jgi:hypothetical protein
VVTRCAIGEEAKSTQNYPHVDYITDRPVRPWKFHQTGFTVQPDVKCPRNVSSPL